MHNANKGIRIAEVGSLRGGKRLGITWKELLVVLAIIALIATFFLSTERGGREAARRMQCSNNLKQIAIALLSYEGRWKCSVPT